MAVGQGFEPRVRYKRTAVFKTAALSHSASPPFFHSRHCDSDEHDTGIACSVNALQKPDGITVVIIPVSDRLKVCEPRLNVI